MKDPNKPSVQKYNNILETFHLKQHIVKRTRMQKTLIDHIITNIPEKLTHRNVVLADEIRDHDLPYVILNIRKKNSKGVISIFVTKNASFVKISERFFRDSYECC